MSSTASSSSPTFFSTTSDSPSSAMASPSSSAQSLPPSNSSPASSDPPTSSNPPSSSLPSSSTPPTSEPSSSPESSTTNPPPPSSTTTPISPSTTETPPTTTPTTTPTPTPVQTLVTVIVSTNSQGIASTITSFVTTDGGVTATETKVNPTLGSDSHSSSGGSSFFKNTGAVAGVFVLVGLAAAAIVLWIILAVRRRRRTRRIEHDTAVSATLAAAGFHRTPLDDDDVADSRRSRTLASPEMGIRAGSALAIRTTGSIPSGGRQSGYLDSPGLEDGLHEFNPYHEYSVAQMDGYVPARTHSPPPSAFIERDASGPEHHPSHSQSHSVGTIGSTEPLLSGFRNPAVAAPAGAARGPTPPPRNPKRVFDSSRKNRRQSTASAYSAASHPDERTNPALRNSDIQDSEDYSRPLGVRNVPDDLSQLSRES
ncbi:hypothetical protein MKEN_00821100 [Mycena kentingensis (nom. inval.)]|nr:hypothetical protein MKEN_00821100 [Mycena kentingensis (nom. inval.)]